MKRDERWPGQRGNAVTGPTCREVGHLVFESSTAIVRKHDRAAKPVEMRVGDGARLAQVAALVGVGSAGVDRGPVVVEPWRRRSQTVLRAEFAYGRFKEQQRGGEAEPWHSGGSGHV